jgi:hypothetical protein
MNLRDVAVDATGTNGRLSAGVQAKRSLCAPRAARTVCTRSAERTVLLCAVLRSFVSSWNCVLIPPPLVSLEEQRTDGRTDGRKGATLSCHVSADSGGKLQRYFKLGAGKSR